MTGVVRGGWGWLVVRLGVGGDVGYSGYCTILRIIKKIRGRGKI